MQETWVQSLDWEDPLGKEMATHSYSFLKNPVDRGDWWATVHGNPWVGDLPHPGEGNGNPLQYSCLETSMHRGAWRATVHGVAKSWT